MTEFISKLEEILPAIELKFPSTPAFGSYKRFLEHAIAHPAKMNCKLLEFLIDTFTKKGETVLDPMAGSGSTGVVAALHGRNAIQVDIEKKFVDWMEKAKENVEKQATLTPKGRIINICGDARNLSNLVSLHTDIVMTSPPYAEVSHHTDDPKDLEHLRPNRKTRVAGTAGESKGNIGHLPLGEVAEENIGNLRKETYLSEMLQVYREMHKVLKKGGLAIIVIKPFVRNKKVVDLPYYTWLLLRKAGFTLHKLYKLRLKNVSFWRILYEKKWKSVPKLRYEYVLIVQK